MRCGKKWYPTRKQAKSERKRLNKLKRARWGHENEDKLTTEYFCTECNGWHTTHMPKATSKKIEKKKLKNKNI